MEPIHLRDYVSGKSLVVNEDKIALAREINGKVSELVLEGENGDLEAVRVSGKFANLADKLNIKLEPLEDPQDIPEGYRQMSPAGRLYRKDTWQGQEGGKVRGPKNQD